jgi:hypothetical protein
VRKCIIDWQIEWGGVNGKRGQQRPRKNILKKNGVPGLNIIHRVIISLDLYQNHDTLLRIKARAKKRKVRPEERKVRPEERKVRPEERKVRPEERKVRPEEKP